MTLSKGSKSIKNKKRKKKRVQINEKEKILKLARSKGKKLMKNGIYILNQKYQLIKYNEETDSYYLKCENGGACLSLANTILVLGLW